VTAEGRRSIGRIAATAGIVSFWAVVPGVVVAWQGYSGTRGEPYSPLNHWISELGQVGVSARAPVFNLALVAAGIGFLLFIVGMALTSPSRLRWAFGPIGALAGIGGALVGIFPMNHPTEHVLAASTFFNLGWIAVALASITFLRFQDERFPRWLVGVGTAAVVAFIAFLVSLRVDEYSRARMAATGAIEGRPDVWVAPILEWAVLVGIMVWTLLAGMTWRRGLEPSLRQAAP
jgi:hypothetical membrane protein